MANYNRVGLHRNRLAPSDYDEEQVQESLFWCKVRIERSVALHRGFSARHINGRSVIRYRDEFIGSPSFRRWWNRGRDAGQNSFERYLLLKYCDRKLTDMRMHGRSDHAMLLLGEFDRLNSYYGRE